MVGLAPCSRPPFPSLEAKPPGRKLPPPPPSTVAASGLRRRRRSGREGQAGGEQTARGREQEEDLYSGARVSLEGYFWRGGKLIANRISFLLFLHAKTTHNYKLLAGKQHALASDRLSSPETTQIAPPTVFFVRFLLGGGEMGEHDAEIPPPRGRL